MLRHAALTCCLIAAVAAVPLAAQRDGWTRPFPGHRVIGNLYAVGTYDLAVFLVTSDEGHFLINTGLEDSTALIRANVESLGFRLEDVRVLLTTQAHWDHTAALAEIKALAGAELWASAGDAPVLEDGGFSDPHFGGRQSFPPVAVDRIIVDGEVLELGAARLAVLASPGHTAGSTSYTMTVREGGRDYDVVIANMATINDGKRLLVDPTYLGVADDFAETFRRQKALDVDVWVASHGGQYGLHDKYEAGQAYDPRTFVDPGGFRAAVERLERLYLAQLAAERPASFRTPWGDPDLQGIWDTDALRSVPLERPAAFGERAVLTAEELAARAATEGVRAVDDRESRPEGVRDLLRTPAHWDEWSDEPSARTSLVVDPPDGRIPPLTPGARLRPDDPSTTIGFAGGSFGDGPFDGPEDYNPIDRCITRGLPNTWFPSLYNNGFQIVQSRDHVAVLYERLHEHRIIPLEGRAPLDAGIRTWFGDSRGRWEGDTLVVEVTNFSDRTNYRGAGATLRLVERYRRLDADTVRVAITVDDPATWTAPWTAVVEGKRDPAYWQIFEYACHEGNYNMTFMLEAARAADRAAAADPAAR